LSSLSSPGPAVALDDADVAVDRACIGIPRQGPEPQQGVMGCWAAERACSSATSAFIEGDALQGK
jgi:hypothetical protein